MTIFETKPATRRQHILAEGPVWVAESSSMIWIDIEKGEMFVGQLAADTVQATQQFDFGEKIGAVVPADDGSLLVAAQDRLVVIEPAGVRIDGPRVLDGSTLRFNDGGVDPAGRFLVGTYHFDERHGADTLQRLESDGSLITLDADLSISNGLAWSPDGTLLYSTDTSRRTIWVRDYDAETGDVGPRRLHLKIESGYPDGMTSDSRGYLWIAIWGGFEVRSFAPDGTPSDVVRVPVPDVSSVCFVADDLDRLLITTSSRDLDAAGRAQYPSAGCLFLADVGVSGQPTTPWKSAPLR